MMIASLVASVVLGLGMQTSSRDTIFNEGWKFHRGDVANAESVGFDDSGWRSVELPHDWSIEDLPKVETVPQIEAVKGQWKFKAGDDLSWAKKSFDDSGWKTVALPDIWENLGGSTEDNQFGWFRRKIEIPKAYVGAEFQLLLGKIDDVDETYFNGVKIGGMGSFPPNYVTAWDAERRYTVPKGLAKGDGSDVIAVRMFDGTNNGGIYAAGTPAVRIGPFDPSASENQDRTGYTVGGIGWYRKEFRSPEKWKRVVVRFEGVYMDSEVFMNGKDLGRHPYGYTSFEYDLTDELKPAGQKNVLAVQVRNIGKNSRWYSGSGIYRNTWLTVTGPVYVPTDGVFVTTPEVSADSATVDLSCEVESRWGYPITVDGRARILDPAGKEVLVLNAETQVAAGGQEILRFSGKVAHPELWDTESPHLYRAEVEIQTGEGQSDKVSVPFGIRKVEIDAVHGFRLNGKPMLLRGGCVHHDNGLLGAEAIDRAEERKVELLKANGYNAIRTSHNPPSQAFLDACDRLGMVVIDEAFDQWHEPKIGDTEDYGRFFGDWFKRDIASMVRDGRNHPSVVMWSVGNEIPEQFRDPATGVALRQEVLLHDPTRAITQAICTDGGDVVAHWAEKSDPAFGHLDVAGYNYLPQFYEPDHVRHPDRVMMGTESFPKDMFDYWTLVEKHPYVIGDFTWTAMDYLGETGIGHSVISNQPDSFFMPWPWTNAWCGDSDICGFKKAQSYYRDVLWRRSEIEMLVHTPIPAGLHEIVSWWGWPDEVKSWNWKGHEGEPMRVNVYSRCEEVRLELNGKEIARRTQPSDGKMTFVFEVPYAAGTLKAVGLVADRVQGESVLTTTGAPDHLELVPDRSTIRAGRSDLAYVTVRVVDKDGRVVPDAEVSVDLKVMGPGELAAAGNGKPNEPSSFRSPHIKTFRGQGMAIVRPTSEGSIRVTASSAGLGAGSADIKVSTGR